ncbi:MAG: DUF2510 domain-containing protein [Actinomycetota bacterium]
MSDADLPVPGWYDDPEQPGQFRFWDGTAWTQHRAPKAHPAATGQPAPNVAIVATDAGSALNQAWELTRTCYWRSAAIIGVFGLIAFIAVMLAFGGVAISTEEGFDGLFEETVETTWDFNPFSVVLWSLSLLGYLAALAFGTPALLAVCEAARHGRRLTVFRAISYAGGRLLATVRKGLLALVIYTAMIALGAAIVLLGTLTGFPLWLAVIITIAYTVYVLPLLTVLLAAPAIGDPAKNSVWEGVQVFAGDWATAAGAFYLIGLVVTIISIPMGIAGLIPLAGIVVTLAYTVVQYGMYAANSLLTWHRLGGDIDPALSRLVAEAPIR